jgi:hypothetical protein
MAINLWSSYQRAVENLLETFSKELNVSNKNPRSN